ncbi:hypothetical protein FB468_1793 [Leucobacter komagatae]|uniref:Large extracellular alpha-helical protein n=1 Tax=Leucobacter komagatae TaxID=55969 RepID=A0A542Y6M3_9MICO|nr:DUF5719 family protein [Leucobacter komagatae]TQL43759.1 hypothetical protein FB468_1793 [Leucobacter komagatae]
MSKSEKFVRGGARALTGLAITGAAAVGVLLLGTVTLPTVERAPHAVSVSTTQAGERNIVCAGAFAELGSDPSRPDVAVPVGEAGVLVSGDGELRTLAGGGEGGANASGARVLTGEAEASIAAVQSQKLSSPSLSGTVASTCVEPVNEQWLVGGGSTLGLSTTLSLGNASEVPATVQITVFDEAGEIDAVQTSGVIVAPNAEQIVSLNGYAPNRERLAVRVTSTGAPVAASLGVARVDGIVPVGASVVTRQLQPATTQVIPGVTNEDAHDHEAIPTDTGPADRFPVLVNAIAPGETAGKASVFAIDAKGTRTALGELELEPRVVGSLAVEAWPHDATAVVVESEVPVFAAAEGAANSGETHDFQWFAPAPEIADGVATAAPIAQGGTLIVANTGAEAAEVTVEGGTAQTVSVPAGAAVAIPGDGKRTITSTKPVHAGVRMLGSGSLAGYPVMPRAEHTGELTVYTR